MIHILMYFVSIGLPNPRTNVRHSLIRNLLLRCYVIFISSTASTRKAPGFLQSMIADSNLDLLLHYVLAARPLYVRMPKFDPNIPDTVRLSGLQAFEPVSQYVGRS